MGGLGSPRGGDQTWEEVYRVWCKTDRGWDVTGNVTTVNNIGTTFVGLVGPSMVTGVTLRHGTGVETRVSVV